MLIRPSRVLCLWALTLGAALSGCAMERLKTVPPASAPQLAGNWTLDAANSEHVDAAVMSLEAQLHGLMLRARKAARAADQTESRRLERAQPRQDTKQTQGAPPANNDTVQEPSVEVSAPLLGASWVREFIAHVPVGDYLGIVMPPGQFTARSAGGSQECSLGVPTVITFGNGTAHQACGWQGSDFLIELRPLLGPRLSERFALEPNGELSMTLHLSGHGIDVRLVRRYRRTPNAKLPILLPTSD